MNSTTRHDPYLLLDGPACGAKALGRARAVAALQAAVVFAACEPAAAATLAPSQAAFGQVPWIALVLAVLVVAVLAGAVIAALMLHRRAGRAVEEAQRLTSLFDVIAEGILVCSGLQIIAANTSICRQTGIGADEVGGPRLELR